MTPKQIALVQSSFEKVIPIAPSAAALFYARLFETTPEVVPFFKSSMEEQGKKLMVTLGVVVSSLGALDAILPVAKSLAIRHVGYGVQAEHYAPVGAALLWTLEQGLGADFTPEVEEAWAAAYGVLSNAMIEAAYPNLLKRRA